MNNGNPGRHVRNGMLAALVVSIVGSACQQPGLTDDTTTLDGAALAPDLARRGTGVTAHRGGRRATEIRSVVRRGEGGVAVTLETSLLPGPSAVTVWAAVFNEPWNCATVPCTSADFDASNGSLLWLDGRVVRANRHARFHGELGVGDDTHAIRGPGLLNPAGAEMHFIFRSHGRPIPEILDEQLTTPGGGCTTFVTPHPPAEDGQCSDMGFVFHMSPQ